MNADPIEPRAWTPRRWWTVVVLVFLLHTGMIFFFGEKKPRPVRTVSNVPMLQLADARAPFVVLSDPTLFALPHANDFATPVWNQPPRDQTNSFRWTEAPRWLALETGQLGGTFNQFAQTNPFVAWFPDFKPAPSLSEPAAPDVVTLPQKSTLRLRGELAKRRLLSQDALPDWPEPEVIRPSKVQVLVNPAGQVISAILLPPDYGLELAAHDDQADQAAVAFARAARFAPGSGTTVGQMIFNWHAVPMPPTNSPPLKP